MFKYILNMLYRWQHIFFLILIALMISKRKKIYIIFMTEIHYFYATMHWTLDIIKLKSGKN